MKYALTTVVLFGSLLACRPKEDYLRTYSNLIADEARASVELGVIAKNVFVYGDKSPQVIVAVEDRPEGRVERVFHYASGRWDKIDSPYESKTGSSIRLAGDHRDYKLMFVLYLKPLKQIG